MRLDLRLGRTAACKLAIIFRADFSFSLDCTPTLALAQLTHEQHFLFLRSSLSLAATSQFE